MRRFHTLASMIVASVAFIIDIHPTLANTTPRPAPSVQLERYMGSWYDVRSIPNDFQRGCTNTMADYRIEASGALQVSNFCRVVDEQGTFEHATTVVGRGWIKNNAGSVLKVSFSCLLGFCAEKFAGDYWILELGPLNSAGLYSWAIVGGPTHEFGWVLSRTPTVSQATMDEIELRLRSHGYNPDSFRMTVQTR